MEIELVNDVDATEIKHRLELYELEKLKKSIKWGYARYSVNRMSEYLHNLFIRLDLSPRATKELEQIKESWYAYHIIDLSFVNARIEELNVILNKIHLKIGE